MPGLGTSFGRGGATTAQQDLKNADAILIMGSSMAENHPVGFQWVIEARERGAKVIHVDPRFNRTSAMADIWVPLRAGSDVLFLGGLINYVLEHGKEFREYVVAYTNASTLLRDDFRDTEDLDGLFSGGMRRRKNMTRKAGDIAEHLQLRATKKTATLPPKAVTARTAEEKPKSSANLSPIPRCRILDASSRF